MYLVDTAVDGAMWPGITCTRANMYVLDDTDSAIYYQCSNGKPYRMSCVAGLCPCIGSQCNKAAGDSMYCTWEANCHRPMTPARDPCESSPCHSGGSCKPLTGGGYRCDCPIGYSGATCEEVIEVVKFTCQNGVEAIPSPDVMSSPSNETYVDEECKTWCFVRENSIEQSVTRGCWYPELFSDGGATPTMPTPVKGCGFFDDELTSTLPGTDQLMCFCRRATGQCNEGSMDSLLTSYRFSSRCELISAHSIQPRHTIQPQSCQCLGQVY
ncbi:hypothetical protein LSAT2_011578 [Lamellibrachia satsuma]|nr:hypothetical protein LSAT2_011578 [Lamellibrachia satsuma]